MVLRQNLLPLKTNKTMDDGFTSGTRSPIFVADGKLEEGKGVGEVGTS